MNNNLISKIIATFIMLSIGVFGCVQRAVSAEKLANKSEFTLELPEARVTVKIEASTFARLDALRDMIIGRLQKPSDSETKLESGGSARNDSPIAPSGSFHWQSRGFVWD